MKALRGCQDKQNAELWLSCPSLLSLYLSLGVAGEVATKAEIPSVSRKWQRVGMGSGAVLALSPEVGETLSWS